MPSTKLKATLKIAGLAVIGLTLGMIGMYLNNRHQQKDSSPFRSMASIDNTRAHGVRMGKQGASLNVDVRGPNVYPNTSREIVELVGYITQQDAREAWVSYEWILPEGVELIKGPVSDNLANVKMGKTQQVKLLIRGFSRESQKLITLKASIARGNTPLGASAVVVTRPEDTPESRTMDLQAQARAAASESKERTNGSK